MADERALEVSPEALRWRCPDELLTFETTAALPERGEALGQDRAVEALRFGAHVGGVAHHIYAMGDPATDRLEVVLCALEQEAGGRPGPQDWCYINRFDDPQRPRVLALEAGHGAQLRADMKALVEELLAALPAAFESQDYRSRRAELEQEFEERDQHALAEVQAEAERNQLGVVRTPHGFAIAPVRNGQMLGPEEFEKLPPEQREAAIEHSTRLTELLRQHIERLPELMREKRRRMRELDRQVTDLAVRGLVGELKAKYREHREVSEYLAEVERDLMTHAQLFQPGAHPPWLMPGIEPGEHATALGRYEVNLLVDNAATRGPPVIYEPSPSCQNLLGRVENIARFGTLTTDFTMIRAGALHRANGGYLVLDAARLIALPYAWEALKRALLSREARIESVAQMLSLISTSTVEPEPVPLAVKVVLVGPRLLYHLLCLYDEDFAALFSVVADFAEHVERTPQTLEAYAALLGTLARRAGLRPLHRSAVARLIEHGIRATGDAHRLSARVRNTVDLLREADYRAAQAGHATVLAADVERAVATQIRRHDRLRELSQDAILREHIHIDTSGERVAQLNGLSYIDLGSFAFGLPARITATARMGEGDVVDIEREAKLGGAIHSKGVLILSAFVAARYAPQSPLSLHATLVFEQTYGGVEGDSASLAETCALLSALAEAPLRQALAVTGSIDQHGRVQVVGGINEKIEGFFDLCSRRGLTGGQGVLIPAENVQHLMLRDEVVSAAAQGRFRVYAVRSVDEAMGLLTGLPAGERGAGGEFPPDTINRRVERRLLGFARSRLAYVRAAREAAADGSAPR